MIELIHSDYRDWKLWLIDCFAILFTFIVVLCVEDIFLLLLYLEYWIQEIEILIGILNSQILVRFSISIQSFGALYKYPMLSNFELFWP